MPFRCGAGGARAAQLAESQIELAAAVLLHSRSFLPHAAQRRLRFSWQKNLRFGSRGRSRDKLTDPRGRKPRRGRGGGYYYSGAHICSWNTRWRLWGGSARPAMESASDFKYFCTRPEMSGEKNTNGTCFRVWPSGYALQFLVHVVLVWVEYNRRNSPQERNRSVRRSRETKPIRVRTTKRRETGSWVSPIAPVG